MNRRRFMETSSLLSASLLMPLTSCNQEAQPKYKMGYQLYSVNDDMKKDPIGTLKKLKSMGYEDFEIYGFDPAKVTYYGLAADDFKKRLEDLELTVTSGHYGFVDLFNASEDDMRHFVDQCIKGAKALHTPYITWPWLSPELRNMESFKKMTGMLNKIGAQINAAGLGFAYHNHGFEFDDHDGEIGFDVIVNGTDPALVKLQMDMYWVRHSSKFTPAELIKKQPGRYVMWHIKDMDKVTRDYTELGNGSIDYLTLLPDPVESGLEYYYIEQGGNFTHSAIQSAETSAQYLKKHLRKFL